MPATLSSAMIRREIGDDHICVLTFDRPESGANIFDATTLNELDRHLDFIENENSLRGLIIASAKKSIFIAGADLKTLLKQAQSGDMRAVHRRRTTDPEPALPIKNPDYCGDPWRVRWRWL
jgi:enoyl-CoA hydratase/carnithine racemase